MAKRRFILLGDKTSHGGTVITASSNMTMDGIPVARIGDLVYCPRCNGNPHQIVGGAGNVTLDGMNLAREGDGVSDGSKLIAGRQYRGTHSDGSGGSKKVAAAAGVMEQGSQFEHAPAAKQMTEDKVVSLESFNNPESGEFVKASFFSGPPKISDKAFEAQMCEWACMCKDKYGKNGTHQSCVDENIRAQFYDETNHPKDNSPVWSEASFRKSDSTEMKPSNLFNWDKLEPLHSMYDLFESPKYPGKPAQYYPLNDTWRMDVVKIGTNGKPEKFYDMKFPGDDVKFGNDRDRLNAYRDIAEKYTGDRDNFVAFDVNKRCPCSDDSKEKEMQNVQEPQKSWSDKLKDALTPNTESTPFPGGEGKKPKPSVVPPILPGPMGLPIPI